MLRWFKSRGRQVREEIEASLVDEDSTAEVRVAREAAENAEAKLRVQRAEGGEVSRQAREARQLRRGNDFSRRMREALGGGHGA